MHSNKAIIITAALLILTILAAGCISTDPVQTKTAAQGNQIDAKETPPKVEAPVEEAEPAPVETLAAVRIVIMPKNKLGAFSPNH